MDQAIGNGTSRSAPIPAARTVMALLAFAAAVTVFGLLTGNPEPGPARAAQPEAAPVASAPESASPASTEGDGNVFMYY
jgi:hypothetical protein